MTSADHVAIRSVIETFITAFCRGDVDAIQPLFTADAVVYPSNDRDRVGWADIADYWRKPFETLKIELQVDVHSVIVDGDLAVAEMVTAAVVTPKSGGEKIQRRYRDMVVLRRAVDAWRIHRNLSQAYPATNDG